MADNKDLFASVVSDIKTYTGKDPILPWIRGIRKMKDSLPSELLNEKLPRFLQKCTQTFESDRRYRNDIRYLRVWLQLMDFVDDPRTLLGAMESKHIGTKHSLFYQAYALYYEKSKNFKEAEKMYHVGVQNLAEPVDELQKSYEQFLCRLKRHNNKITKRKEKSTKEYLSGRGAPLSGNETEVKNQMPHENDGRTKKITEGSSQQLKTLTDADSKDLHGPRNKQQAPAEKELGKSNMFCGDDTIVAKFVGTAIVGKSEAEDVCHHGLVEPTINMKEAMNAINSMFSEPLETAPVGRSHKRLPNNDVNRNNEFPIFIDESLDNGVKLADQREENSSRNENFNLHQEPFSIFIDDDDDDDENRVEDNLDRNNFCNSREDNGSASCANVFVFPTPKDHQSEGSDDMDVEDSHRPRFREDTVVCRFVGSAILDEPEVENACHHGLVDPTINLKEAMDDINNMFGKPMDFVRTRRSIKQDKTPKSMNDFGGFSILPDEDLKNEPPIKQMPKLSGKPRGFDLFEPTMVTKEALDDINKMFGMPLD
ncbi:hypothetical protein CsatB_010009 [Cannabis sativa]